MQALPVILPVRYAVIGETVVFRTAPGTKLTAAMRRSVVAFEADRGDPCGAWGWSVLVQGVASEVTDPALQAAARGLLANDLPFLDGEVARLVAVEVAFLSGRAFGTIPKIRRGACADRRWTRFIHSCSLISVSAPALPGSRSTEAPQETRRRSVAVAATTRATAKAATTPMSSRSAPDVSPLPFSITSRRPSTP